MRIIRALIIACLILVGLGAKAQQRAVFSTYPYNGLALNPAYAGSLNLFSAIFTHRNQWVNIEGAPSYQNLTAHTVFKENQVGTGLNITRDAVGVHTQYAVYVSGAYKIRMNKGILSMGLQGGFDQRSSDFNMIDWFDNNDGYASAYVNDFNPNFGVGLYFANRDFFLGASVPYILTPEITYDADVSSSGKASRYYYVNGGFVKDISRGIKINPSFLLRIQDRTPFAYDINCNLIFNEIVYAGLSYRSGDSFSVMTQLVLNENFRVGYAYDIPTSDLNGYTAGSHEILLNYRIRLKTSKKDGLCPVYF